MSAGKAGLSKAGTKQIKAFYETLWLVVELHVGAVHVRVAASSPASLATGKNAQTETLSCLRLGQPGASSGRSSAPSRDEVGAHCFCAKVRPVRPWLRSTSSPVLARFCPVKTRQALCSARLSRLSRLRLAVLRAGGHPRLAREGGVACFCTAFQV